MRLGSFRVRLIIGSVVWICLGLAASSLVLTSLFRAAVATQFDHDAFDHARELTNVLSARGDCPRIPPSHPISDARFIAPKSGAYWQIRCRDGSRFSSPSLGEQTLPMTLSSEGLDTAQVTVVDGPSGPMRLVQVRTGMNLIGVGLDERLVSDVSGDFERTLRLSLAFLAIGLAAAAVLQVTLGLRPLTRVRTALQAIRNGQADRLPDNLPEEVAPLASDLNALLNANEEIMRGARARAGNLAHALKTPLAILVDEGSRLRERGEIAAAGVVEEQCRRMQVQIDYEMARGRAASNGVVGSIAEVGPIVRTISSAVARIYRGRELSFDIEGDENLRVACDPQDLSEIVGNLVDNAAKWARSQVSVSIQRKDREAIIRVEDDGPGIPPASREAVFKIGARLDESVPGTGLGLAITRDLVAARHGRIAIGESRSGGAALTVALGLAG